jgi:hypothetical protein
MAHIGILYGVKGDSVLRVLGREGEGDDSEPFQLFHYIVNGFFFSIFVTEANDFLCDFVDNVEDAGIAYIFDIIAAFFCYLIGG